MWNVPYWFGLKTIELHLLSTTSVSSIVLCNVFYIHSVRLKEAFFHPKHWKVSVKESCSMNGKQSKTKIQNFSHVQVKLSSSKEETLDSDTICRPSVSQMLVGGSGKQWLSCTGSWVLWFGIFLIVYLQVSVSAIKVL